MVYGNNAEEGYQQFPDKPERCQCGKVATKKCECGEPLCDWHNALKKEAGAFFCYKCIDQAGEVDE